jgi:hypothetical protein
LHAIEDYSMENPYWKTNGRTHQIDVQSMRRLGFEIVNIIEASATLAQSFEAEELEAKRSLDLADYPLLALHLELAEGQLSQLLLQLCLMVRTHDDVMAASTAAETHLAQAKKTDGSNYIGSIAGDGKFDLREACNKVIHAAEIRAVYERIDRAPAEPNGADKLDQDVWYLTSEVELKGTQHGKAWQATLHTQDFIETVLERIAFRVP